MKSVSLASQITRLDEIGFLRASGISAESLHKQFDHESVETDSEAVVKVLVISPTRLPLLQQYELAGIAKLDIDPQQMKHLWTPSQDAYIVMIRIDDEKMAIKSARQTQAREFQQGERGATVVEAVHLYVQYPQLLNRHCFDCHGTLYGQEGLHLPILYLWNGRPEMGEACPGVFCQAATMGGPTLRVLDPVPDKINWEG